MLNPFDVAEYFLSIDNEKKLFNQNLVERNGRRFYEGNAKLNKFMHLAQNIYVAKTGELLIDTAFYAYDNGAVIPEIQENYIRLLTSSEENHDFASIPDEIKVFLKKIYMAFSNASLDEIIELDHEDVEWQAKKNGYTKKEQYMDTLSRADVYKQQYKDMLKVLDRMVCE